MKRSEFKEAKKAIYAYLKRQEAIWHERLEQWQDDGPESRSNGYRVGLEAGFGFAVGALKNVERSPEIKALLEADQ